MKTIKITVNKSQQQPEGIEIEVVEPENKLEERVLTYLLAGFVRDTKTRGVLKLDIPDQFTVSYERQGSFVLASGPGTPSLSGDVHTYYTPSKPLAVLAIHTVGGRMDVVYGQIGERRPDADAPPSKDAAATEPKAETKAEPEVEPPAEPKAVSGLPGGKEADEQTAAKSD